MTTIGWPLQYGDEVILHLMNVFEESRGSRITKNKLELNT